MTLPTESYRPDVDGLRAIAVFLVMFYHAGFGWVSGGFIGVDVFFVISGFVIARQSLMLQSLNKFSAVDFYARRARRILPPLLFMLVVVSVPVWLLLLPRDLARYGDSLLASAAFYSNFYFWLQSGYFAPESEEQLLLHTWSLAVEEQFYLLWPLAIHLLGRISPARMKSLLCGGLALGLAAAVWTTSQAPSASFFLAPARAWEFMAGVTLALPAVSPLKRGSFGVLVQFAGLSLIAFSALAFDSKTPFPGLGALRSRPTAPIDARSSRIC